MSLDLPLRDDFGSVPLSLDKGFNINKLVSYSNGKNPFRLASCYTTLCWLLGHCSYRAKQDFKLCRGCQFKAQWRITDFVECLV